MNENTVARFPVGAARRASSSRVLVVLLLLLAGTWAGAQDPGPAESSDTLAEPEAGDYEIGLEDRLRIHVWQDPDLRAGSSYTVRPDGWISFPLVGEIQAEGRTPTELSHHIKERIAAFVPDARVDVIVEAVNSFKFYLLGEANGVGVFQVGSRLKMLQALAIAGGISDYAEKDNIVLVRTVEGKEVRQRLNYKKILAGDPEHNVWVRPGDTIIVN